MTDPIMSLALKFLIFSVELMVHNKYRHYLFKVFESNEINLTYNICYVVINFQSIFLTS